MKKLLVILLAFALVFGLVLTGCPNGSTGGGNKPPVVDPDPDPDPDLEDLVVDGKDIVLKYCGNSGKAEMVSGNTFELDDVGDLSNVGFYYEFPADVVGKGYGTINVEMEVISITTPDFIGFMTFAKSDFSGPVKVLDKKTETQKTGDYDHEFKLGVECEKGATGDTAEGGDGILDGSSKKGVKQDYSYPFVKFTDRIAFQPNPYAGNITTAGFGSSSKATYKIAVTKVTFVGGAVADSPVDAKAIPGVTPPASGGTPVTTIGSSDQYTGTVEWKDAGGTAVGATFADDTAYTATITLTEKEGFTFTGVAADFFTVAGATATNPKDSGVVTAVFPKTSAPATSLTITVGGVAKKTTGLTGHKGTVALLNDGSGYTFTAGTGDNTAYDWSYVVFKVDLGEQVSAFNKITFNVAETTYKEIWALASSTDISGYYNKDSPTDTAEATLFIDSGEQTLKGGPDVDLAINATEAAKVTGTDIYIAINVRVGSGDSYIVTDIKFVK